MCQTLFSPLGFNPTDDGFVLAYSRRILAGQIPHRDFISIRPVGSPLMHIPEVAFGGSHTYLISRLVVWLEFAGIALLICDGIRVRMALKPSLMLYVAAIVLCFCLSANTFVLTAWHTIDGLLLASLGLALISRQQPSSRTAGYMALGAAAICKQNFFAIGAAALLIEGGWKKPAYVGAWLLPPLIYVSTIGLLGGLPQAVGQLTAQSDIARTGFLVYLSSPLAPLGAVTGVAAILLISINHKGWRLLTATRLQGVGALVLYGVVLLGVIALQGGAVAPGGWSLNAFGSGADAFNAWSVFEFGAVLGGLAALLLTRPRDWAVIRTAALILALAWSASISVGWNNPSLASGATSVLLLALASRRVASWPRPLLTLWAPAVLLAAVTVGAFFAARETFIYRDQPSTYLTSALDGALPGGDGVRTNETTYAVLRNLSDISQRYDGTRLAVVPDMAGFWPEADRLNPLPIDWPQPIELNEPQLEAAVDESLLAERGNIVVAVEKYEAPWLAYRPIPLDDRNYPVVALVRRNFTKVEETPYFEIYR
jgi:hypothetical protein